MYTGYLQMLKPTPNLPHGITTSQNSQDHDPVERESNQTDYLVRRSVSATIQMFKNSTKVEVRSSILAKFEVGRLLFSIIGTFCLMVVRSAFLRAD